LTRGWAVI